MTDIERDDIEWITPPEPKSINWRERLAPLVDKPGEWAVVARKPKPSTAYSTANNLRSGKCRVPEGEWEFQAATDIETGEGLVRACYVMPKTAGRRH